MSTAIKSICIMRLSAIGDVCNAVAAVQAIQQQHPQAKITWIIGKIEHSLLEGLPGIDFYIFDKRAGKAANQAFRASFKHRQFDVLLHMQVALRASLLSRHIKAKRKIGFDRDRSKELQGLFVNERIKARANAHVLEGFFDFAQAVGVDPQKLENPTWNIPLHQQDHAFAQATIEALSPDANALPVLIIVPSASKPERNWISARYAQLCDYAADKGFTILLCGGPSQEETALADDIAFHCNQPPHNLTGKTTLKQLLALLKLSSVLVSPDTGPAHMAVSQGTPVIGLYGHSNPKRTGPYLFQHYVVEVYHRHLALQQGKSPRDLPWGKRVKGDHIMADIETSEVFAMLDRVCEDYQLLAPSNSK